MEHLRFCLRACLGLLAMLMAAHTEAQTSRQFIKQQIEYHGECRNVAITKYNGDVMLYGSNGWAASGCPQDLTEALNELNSRGEYIDDVQLTEQGRWLVLYGDNGVMYSNIPYSLERKMREWNSGGEVITSLSFNDDGDWVAVSTNYICASDARIQEWIADRISEYGKVWATCVTDDAIVVVYESGVRTLGVIPPSLSSKIRNTPINIYRLKIAGDAWFFSDGVSNYDYYM